MPKKKKREELCKFLCRMIKTAVVISILEKKRDYICCAFHGERVICNLAYLLNHHAQHVT